MNNLKIRIEMAKHGLKQWQVAELLGVSDSVLSVKLRKELPDEEQDRIISLIKERKEV